MKWVASAVVSLLLLGCPEFLWFIPGSPNLALQLPSACAGELFVGFWNLENLFDTQDDPRVRGDEQYTPNGAKQWDPSRMNTKLRNLARVVKDMHGGRGPDILGMCEIENATVVRQLEKELRTLGRQYDIVHDESPNQRGIDCGLIYDRRRMKLRESRSIFVSPATRNVLEAEFDVGGRPLFVFVNHWPSRYSPESTRIEAAQKLRARVNQLLKTDPATDFVIIGDLNDTPVDPSVQQHLKTWGDPDSLHPGTLFNSTFRLHRDDRGSYVYDNHWIMLDHIILSPGMLDTQGISWKNNSTQLVVQRYQLFYPSDLTLIPRPSRSYSGDKFHADGFSDHLPIACILRY